MTSSILIGGEKMVSSLLNVAKEAKEYFESGATLTIRISNQTTSSTLKTFKFVNGEKDKNTTVGVMPPLFIGPGETVDSSFSASKFFSSSIGLQWFIQKDKLSRQPLYYLDFQYLWKSANSGQVSVKLDDLSLTPEEQKAIPRTDVDFYIVGSINYSAYKYQVIFVGSGSTAELIVLDGA